MNFEPIGIFRGGAARKYEAPRQGVFSGNPGRIELAPGRNFETALRDLDGFERIWLVFVFDRNGGGWRPTAHPPVTAPGVSRVGVFASRAPYRPNPIGLSCVRLVGVHGRVVEVEEADLLDGTPIYDIKPYLPHIDSHPEARGGFAAEKADYALKVDFPEALLDKIDADKREAICGVLAGDPRPSYQHDPARVYGVRYAHYNVKFTVADGTLTVCDVMELPAGEP